MHKWIVPLAVPFLLLTSAFVFSFTIRSVNAADPVYVRADGSVDPLTAPISAMDNATSTLNDNITRALASTSQSPAASSVEVADPKAINLSGMTIGVHVRSNTSTNAMSRYLPLMQEAGITTVRLEFNNPSMPNLRDLVPAIAQNGIKIIGLLLRTDLAPDNLDPWGSWVHSVVDEFKRDVHVWELWNEPNLDKFFPGNDSVKYTNFLKRGYEEAKNADPTCFTLGGSIATTRDTSLNFLRTIFENDGGDYMDALSYHPYCDSYAPEDTTNTSHPYVYLTRVRNLMNEYRQQDKKIWITEMGWASSETGETLQAQYLLRALELASDWGWVDTFIIYNWKDTTNTTGTDKGLMRIDETLKPSYYTVKDFIKGHVQLLSHTSFMDNFGCYNVVGEIGNIGDQAVSFVEVTSTFYDASNSAVATRKSTTMLDVLLVDRKSPFIIKLLDTTLSKNVDHYSLNFTFLPTTTVSAELQIISNTSFIDEDGFRIIGQIKNIANTTASNVRVIATYYDGAGKIMYAKLELLDPILNDLEPNQTREFEILFSERDSVVGSYYLTAESDEYAIIDEFPNAPTIILVMTVVLIVVCTSSKIVERQNFAESKNHLARAFHDSCLKSI